MTTNVLKAIELIIDENKGRARVFFTYIPRGLEHTYEFKEFGSLFEPGAKRAK